MTLANLYGVSHTFLDELLSFISGDLLPLSNCMPRSKNEIKRMIMRLGLEHVPIDCCLEGCVLYEKGGEYENLWECPKCQKPRFVESSNDIPLKQLCYFPIISRLRRLLKCPKIAELLKWHVTNRPMGSKLTSVVGTWKPAVGGSG
jgi:hypothetical protein